MTYNIQNQMIEQLPESYNGLCTSLVINNYSNKVIGTIDKFGNTERIDPEPFGSNNKVKIWFKKGSGNCTEYNRPKSQPGFVCELDISDITTTPVYIKEIDLLICDYVNIKHHKHPIKSLSKSDLLTEIYREANSKNEVTVPTVKILANSPNPEIKEVFINLFGYVVRIHVTHLPTAEDGVTILFPEHDLKRLYASFEELKENKGYVILDDIKYYMGLTRNTVINAMFNEHALIYSEEDVNKIKEDVRKELQSEFDKLVKETKKSAELGIEVERNKYKLIIAEKDDKIRKMDNELHTARMTIDELKARWEVEERERKRDYDEKKMKADLLKVGLDICKLLITTAIGFGIGKLFS